MLKPESQETQQLVLVPIISLCDKFLPIPGLATLHLQNEEVGGLDEAFNLHLSHSMLILCVYVSPSLSDPRTHWPSSMGPPSWKDTTWSLAKHC